MNAVTVNFVTIRIPVQVYVCPLVQAWVVAAWTRTALCLILKLLGIQMNIHALVVNFATVNIPVPVHVYLLFALVCPAAPTRTALNFRAFLILDSHMYVKSVNIVTIGIPAMVFVRNSCSSSRLRLAKPFPGLLKTEISGITIRNEDVTRFWENKYLHTDLYF